MDAVVFPILPFKDLIQMYLTIFARNGEMLVKQHCWKVTQITSTNGYSLQFKTSSLSQCNFELLINKVDFSLKLIYD